MTRCWQPVVLEFSDRLVACREFIIPCELLNVLQEIFKVVDGKSLVLNTQHQRRYAPGLPDRRGRG